MFEWLFGRKLENAVYATKTVRVHGVKFKIRKINPLDYLQGSKSIRQVFDTFQMSGIHHVELTQNQIKDMKAHYSDVFMTAVVEPKLKREKDQAGDGLPVEHLLTEWELANELYERVLEFTYGKKKLTSLLRAFQKTVA